MPPTVNIFQISILITPGWILIGSVLGMWGLWKWPMTTLRFMGLVVFGLITIALVWGSWWSAVQQARHDATTETSRQEIDRQSGDTHRLVAQLADRLSVRSTGTTDELLRRIEKQIGPREITPTESTEIANELHAAGIFTFQLSLISNDRETLAFARQLFNSLVLAGWQPANGIGVRGGFTPGILGVVVSGRARELYPRAYQALINSLSKAGIVLNDDVNRNSFAGDGVVEILIGPKS